MDRMMMVTASVRGMDDRVFSHAANHAFVRWCLNDVDAVEGRMLVDAFEDERERRFGEWVSVERRADVW